MKLEPTAKRAYLCLSIEGFMRTAKWPKDYNCFEQEDGTPMTSVEALGFIATEKAKGRKLIPGSANCGNPCQHADNGCTGFDYHQGGCPGHYITKGGAA